jgi:hypothetical protein
VLAIADSEQAGGQRAEIDNREEEGGQRVKAQMRAEPRQSDW